MANIDIRNLIKKSIPTKIRIAAQSFGVLILYLMVFIFVLIVIAFVAYIIAR